MRLVVEKRKQKSGLVQLLSKRTIAVSSKFLLLGIFSELLFMKTSKMPRQTTILSPQLKRRKLRKIYDYIKELLI